MAAACASPIAGRRQLVDGVHAADVTAIWVSIALISVLSPDMVHGSEHQRMPVAAFGAWFWAFGASIVAAVAMARLRRRTSLDGRQSMMVAGVTTTDPGRRLPLSASSVRRW